MPFVPKKQAFNAHINEVVLGVGDKATAIGGQNVLPFHTFDAEIKNAPKIGVELTDLGMAEYTMPGEKAFYAGCTTVAEMAKRAETLEGASFICLHLEGADPNGLNKSVEECVQLAKDVADADELPQDVGEQLHVERAYDNPHQVDHDDPGDDVGGVCSPGSAVDPEHDRRYQDDIYEIDECERNKSHGVFR